MVRPSYVLGGRAMEIVHDPSGLEHFVFTAMEASRRESLSSRAGEEDAPILIDQFLPDAIEVDVDVVADGTTSVIGGVMEHIEEAGMHSGDSACCLPPYSLPPEIVEAIKTQARALAQRAGRARPDERAVRGAARRARHLHPRGESARVAHGAVRLEGDRRAAGEDRGAHRGRQDAEGDGINEVTPKHVAVKEAVFPFAKFAGVDTILGPEMRSTGEVMGIDTTFAAAFGKSQIGAGTQLPMAGRVFLSVQNSDKPGAVAVAEGLRKLGFELFATAGTQDFLTKAGIEVERVNKVREGRPHCVDRMLDGDIQLVVNTTAGAQAIKDSFPIRRTALVRGVPYYTTLSAARAAVGAMGELRAGTHGRAIAAGVPAGG